MPGFWSDFYHYARERKKWWLIPILLVFLLVAGLVLFTTSSFAAPFIYTLF